MPVFNESASIRKSVDSIVNQTLKNFELIIVNDGSTDETEDICIELKQRYKNIVYIHQENKGPGAARNLGLENASGEYIGFVDADDYIDSEMFETMYSYAVKFDADIVQTGYSLVSSNGNLLRERQYVSHDKLIEGRDVLLEYAKNKITDVFLVTKLFKRDIFENIRLPNYFYGEDQVTLVKAFDVANRLIVIPFIHYQYIMSEDSLVRGSFSKKVLDNFKAFQDMYNYYETHDAELKSFASEKICLTCVRTYKYLDNSLGKYNKTSIKNLFNDHYRLVKEEIAYNYLSKNKKLIYRLFSICPMLASILLNFKEDVRNYRRVNK